MSFIIFVSIVLRSIHVPLHYDEILNYFLYAEPGSFQPFFSRPDANNHLVSTAFNHLMYLIFGNNLVLMRLPNTLFFLLYLWYLWKFKKFFKNEWIGNCFLLTMIGSFYLLSFFSMARGYSFSITFLLAGIYHLFQYRKNNPSLLNLFLICLFGGLTIWSNLALIPLQMMIYFLAALGFLNHLRRKEIKSFISSLLILIIIAGLPAISAVLFSFHLKELGALYLGVPANFYRAVWMDLPTFIFSNLKWGQILISVGAILTLAALFFQHKKIKLTVELSLAIILFITAFGSAILMHVFLDVNYPQNRAALHFLIVSLLLFFMFADQLNNFWNKIAYYPVFTILSHSILTVNLSYHCVWRHEAFDEKHYFAIAECQKNYDELLTISAPGLSGRVLDHYNFEYNLKVNTFQEKDYPSPYADILVVNSFTALQDPENYNTLFTEPSTSISVLERKTKLKWKKIGDSKIESFTSNLPFIQLDTFRIIPESGSHLKVEYFVELLSEKKPCNAWLVVTCETESKNYFATESIEIQRVIDDYNKVKSINKSYYFTNLPPEPTLVSVYIWNIRNTNWEIYHSGAILYQNIDE